MIMSVLGLVILADIECAKNKELMDDNSQRCLLAFYHFLNIVHTFFAVDFFIILVKHDIIIMYPYNYYKTQIKISFNIKLQSYRLY